MTDRSDFANGATVPPTLPSPPLNHVQNRPSISGSTGHFKHSLAPAGKDVVHLMRAPTFDHYDSSISPCVRTEQRKRNRNPGLTHAKTMPMNNQEADLEAALRQVRSAPTGSGNLEEHQRDGPIPITGPGFPKSEEHKHPYLVFGIYNRVDGRPQEDMLVLEDKERLFADIFWSIARLRGPAGLFSLKDVKQFSIFTVRTTHFSDLSVLPNNLPDLLPHTVIYPREHTNSVLVRYDQWYPPPHAFRPRFRGHSPPVLPGLQQLVQLVRCSQSTKLARKGYSSRLHGCKDQCTYFE